MKINVLILLFVFLAAVVSAFGLLASHASPVSREQHWNIVIRNIGHQLLRYAGDSTSRVLPVRQMGQGVFQLEFENSFSFVPDSLVKIVRSNLAAESLPSGYEFTVQECSPHAVIYGFEITQKNTGIIPCSGRIQPLGCYLIRIAFPSGDAGLTTPWFYLLGAAGLGFIGFIGRNYFKKEITPVSKVAEGGYNIGCYKLYATQKILKKGGTTVALSDKETEILSMLAVRPNELILREHLLKQVWEDQGVFTGRSLDMFISRLRKKLIGDPGIKITNIHGRGYKLEVPV